MASKIERCGTKTKPKGIEYCLLPICPLCGRQYRRTLIGDLLQIYNLNPSKAQTATVYLGEYKAGTLENASLRTAHDTFRKQLERCGFGGAIIIGGIEVAYRPQLSDWLLHLHLLCLGAPEKTWDNLEKCLSKHKIRDPLRLKPAEDPINQLS
jgi:hypothetical protein